MSETCKDCYSCKHRNKWGHEEPCNTCCESHGDYENWEDGEEKKGE